MRKHWTVLMAMITAACFFFLVNAFADGQLPGPAVEIDDPGHIPVNSTLVVRLFCENATDFRYDLTTGSGGRSSSYHVEDPREDVSLSLPIEDLWDGAEGSIVVAACVDGEWTEDTVVPLTFYRLGTLSVPEVHIKSDTIPLGEAVQVNFSAVDNASNYMVSYGRLNEDHDSLGLYMNYITEETHFLVEGDSDRFHPGYYGLKVTAMAEGWGMGESQLFIVKRPEAESSGPKILCDDTLLAGNHEADFTFSRTNAEAFMYEFPESWKDPVVVQASGGKAVAHIQIPHDEYDTESPEYYLLRARAKVGGKWTGYTDKKCYVDADSWELVPHLTFSANIFESSPVSDEYGFYSSSWQAMGVENDYTYVIPSDQPYAGAVGLGCFQVKPENTHLIWERTGTAPIWTVEQIAGDKTDFILEDQIANEGSWRGLIITLKKNPARAQDIVFRITCDWAGHSSSELFTLHYVKADLPKGNTVPNVILMQAGKEQDFNFDLSPAPSWNDGRTDYDVRFSDDGFFSSDSYGLINLVNATMTPLKAGVVKAYFTFYNSNYAQEAEATLLIADKKGNYPVSMSGADLVLPSGLKRIEDESFRNIPEGSMVWIPSGIEYISPSAFDASVTLLCEKGSRAQAICESLGVTVIPCVP